MAPNGMLKVTRNMQLCSGERSCGECLRYLPPLRDGDFKISSWAFDHNHNLIDLAIMACPTGAITVETI